MISKFIKLILSLLVLYAIIIGIMNVIVLILEFNLILGIIVLIGVLAGSKILLEYYGWL